MQYETVFDISQKGPQLWWPLMGLAATVLATVCLVVIYFIKFKGSHQYAKLLLSFSIAIIAFGCMWSFIAFMSAPAEYRYYKSKLDNGEANVVEGRVENFVPMPYEGKAVESFTVNGVKFEYSDYVITPGFNTTSSHGDPIREGLYVRIYYLDGIILRLDILRNQ